MLQTQKTVIAVSGHFMCVCMKCCWENVLDVKYGWENVLDVKLEGNMCLEQLFFHRQCMYKFGRG